MMGTIDYSPCAVHLPHGITVSYCPNICGWCNDHSLIRPQCFACFYFRQFNCSCTIHGQLPDAVGCCGLYVKSPLTGCFAGWSHQREWGIDCGYVDSIGCEECQKRFMPPEDN